MMKMTESCDPIETYDLYDNENGDEDKHPPKDNRQPGNLSCLPRAHPTTTAHNATGPAHLRAHLSLCGAVWKVELDAETGGTPCPETA